MSFSTDKNEDGEQQLFLNNKEVHTEDGEVFDLVASSVTELHLSELPLGFKVQLCDRVIGSINDFDTREPHAIFENSKDQGLLAHLSTPFFVLSEDYPNDQIEQYLNDSIDSGIQVLNSLKNVGRLVKTERKLYENIAYLDYCIRIHDQTFQNAED